MSLDERYERRIRFYSYGKYDMMKKVSAFKMRGKEIMQRSRAGGRVDRSYKAFRTGDKNELKSQEKMLKRYQKPYEDIKYDSTRSASPTRSGSSIKTTSKGSDYLVPNVSFPKKYSLSSCLGFFDLKGQQMTLNTLSYPLSAPKQLLENTKKSTPSKKVKSIYFRLPAVCTPTPWEYDPKSADI